MNATATITSKGQITIPKAIRDLLDVAASDVLVFTVRTSKEVLVSPVKTDLMSLQGAFKAKKYIPLSVAREKLQTELGRKLAKTR